MQIKSFNVEIPDNDPFQFDLLDREKYAKNLTQIVKKFNDGLVLAIDGQWGSGKTTFINMWNKYLLKEKITTLHFNAWESDYQSEVLPALISKLSSIIQTKSTLKTNLLKTAGKVLVGFGAAVIDNKLGDGFTKDLTKIGLEEGEKIMTQAIENFESKQKTFEEFKSALTDYTASIDKKPIVFFIDELDRCKPSYAVEVLELVKHLFSVPGIVFVIATDKTQLANSIRGYYGSDLLDGKSYLERIFDIEYKLPEPDLKKFSRKIFHYYGFTDYYSAGFSMSVGLKQDSDNLQHMIIHGFGLFNFSLRKQIRILSKTRIILNSYNDGWKTYPSIIILLYILMLDFPELYEAISKHKVSPNNLHLELEKVLPDTENPSVAEGFNLLMVLFIRSYTLSYQKKFSDFKYVINQGTPHAEVKTKFDIEGDDRHKSYNNTFIELFHGKNSEEDLYQLGEYIERVEFLKDIYI